MQPRDDHGRTRLGVLFVLLAVVFAGFFGFMSSAAAAPATPSGTTTTATTNSLPITLNLLGIKISVVLPSLNQIIRIGTPTSTPTSSSSTPPPPSSSTPPPTSSSPKPSTSRRTSVAPPPAQFVAGPPATSRPPKPATSTSTSSSTPPKPQKTKTSQPVAERVDTLLHNLLPTSLAGLLYLVTLIACVGIAFGVMRLGRRGSH